jgi:succinyl-diaminopimelate desuccinylase
VTLSLDPVELTQALVRCQSVSPQDAGALAVVEDALNGLGFVCHRLEFADGSGERVANLYARIGESAPNFCFAGHTDVVPSGDPVTWTVDPFAGVKRNGHVFGRGAVDMKGAIACFLVATERFLAAREGTGFPGSISLLITGDEEGRAVNGTVRVLEWMAEKGERIEACLVGEPTGREQLGDMVKVGRRGSLVARLGVRGVGGHSAYPHLADNPVPRLIRMLAALAGASLDKGAEQFDPSHLEIVSVDVGNPVTNVIPSEARAVINIRYNNLHDADSLTDWLRQRCEAAGGAVDLEIESSGEAFISPPGPLSELIVAAVEKITGRVPELSTSGGTSDARFLHHHAPVVELGLVGKTAHKADEKVAIADLHALVGIYESVLGSFFGRDE